MGPRVVAFDVASRHAMTLWRPGIGALVSALVDRVFVPALSRRTGVEAPWPAISPDAFYDRHRYELGVLAFDRRGRRLVRDTCSRERWQQLVDGLGTGSTWRLEWSVSLPDSAGHDGAWYFANLELVGNDDTGVSALSGYVSVDGEDLATIDAIGSEIGDVVLDAADTMDASSGIVGYPRLSRHEWRRGIRDADGRAQSRDRLRGGGWLTIGSADVLAPLGGPARVVTEAPVAIATRTDADRVALKLSDALSAVDDGTVGRLDAYLAPVLVQRPPDAPGPVWGDGDPPETLEELYALMRAAETR
jgi:hypothetical protein